jgi:hypothetical protein
MTRLGAHVGFSAATERLTWAAVRALQIRHAELVESRAHTHFVWLGPDWPAIAERIQAFLDAAPPQSVARDLVR